MKKIYTGVLTILIAGSILAQEDTTKAKELGEVVITGQYKPQSVKNSVYQVKVITKERIQKQGATKLQDVLNNELNIRFSQDPATGGSDITMMGLKGQNVKILLDGMPLVGRQGTSNEININQIDINSIERIEIVEGPMSVIYGADALAGVINIITKKATGSKISVTARVQEETVGKEYDWKTKGIHNQYIGLTWRNKRWELGGNFGYNYFGGWKDTAIGRELVWHWKDQIIANGFIGYNTGKFNLRYRIDGLDEIITNPGNFTPWPEAGDSVAHDQEYLSRRVMQQLQTGYFVNNNLSFQAQASYTDYERQVFSTLFSQNTGKVSMDAPQTQGIVTFKGFAFRGTALYRISSFVSLQPGADINIESGEGERLKTGNNKIGDYAFFITSEIAPSLKISIRPGLRFIHNSVYDAPPVIPSINTKFALSKSVDLRLAYARGFRSPSLRELYFNFIDANHTILGNPDLKAETSHSFTGSLSWKKITAKQATYTVILGGFYNNVKNLIDYAFSTTSDTTMLANVSNSKTAGVNLSTTARYKNWNVSIGASYTGFYNDYSETDESLPELQWSSEVNATLGYTFSKIGLDANLFYKFTGKQPSYVLDAQGDIVLSELKGYQMADLTFNKRFSKTFLRYISINAGIRNLFDTDRVNRTIVSTGGVHTGSGSGRNIAYGRSYFAGLVFNWDKK